MRSLFTADDWSRLLDWAVIGGLGSLAVLWLAFVAGVAVLLFRLVGGV